MAHHSKLLVRRRCSCCTDRGSEVIECSYSHLLLALVLLRDINRVHHPDGLAGHLRLHSSSVLGYSCRAELLRTLQRDGSHLLLLLCCSIV